jgi:hypothetical protein
MGRIDLTDTVECVLFMLAIVTLILVALVAYLIGMLARVETLIWRMRQALRPDVIRDMNGKRIQQRL